MAESNAPSSPREERVGPPLPACAAEAMNRGHRTFRTSLSGQPRGPLCGMGICFECRDDHAENPHLRTCLNAPQSPSSLLSSSSSSSSLSSSSSSISADILVVGAGPAGLAAAWAAATSGRRVVLIDDNPGRGGQLWRGDEPAPKSALARRWFDRFRAAQVPTFTGCTVIGSTPDRGLVAERGPDTLVFRAPRIILATGARELFLPFPGWTHPQVLGAGGVQALAKSGFDVRGRTVIVAGSGPLLLAVAQNLRHRGARVPFITEQAERSSILRFGLSLLAHPGKLAQAIALQVSLLSVPYRTACWPIRAEPDGVRLRVTFRKDSGTFTAACDELACGWGLVPNTELPSLLGCAITRQVVSIDDFQQTSRPGIYTAGETTGIAGVDAALVAGQIAGFAAADQPDRARALFKARDQARRFAAGLERAFALRPELKEFPDDDTLVCRCEDVPFGRLRAFGSWTEAKLQTRCGMGPCQGRVCGPAAAHLLGWEVKSIRPPVFPVSVASLAALAEIRGESAAGQAPHDG